MALTFDQSEGKIILVQLLTFFNPAFSVFPCTFLVPRPTLRQLGATGKTLLALAVAGTGVTSLSIGYALHQDWKRLARNWTSNTHLTFPASSNYPDLSQHNNTMAKVLTPEVRFLLVCCNATLNRDAPFFAREIQ